MNKMNLAYYNYFHLINAFYRFKFAVKKSSLIVE